MAIKAAEVTPVKKTLIESDESGESWVMVQPASYRHEMLRGEYLKLHSYTITPADVTEQQIVNRYHFDAMEIWTSYPEIDTPCHIEVETEDEKGVAVTLEPFKQKKEMTLASFLDALGLLTYPVIKEWHKLVCEVNPGWGRPF